MSRTPRLITPEGREAIEDAKAAGDLVRDARRTVFRLAERRRAAVVRARRAGVPYRRLADELGVSVGSIQQLVSRATRDRADPPG